MFEKWNREVKRREKKRESNEALMWRALLYEVSERALFGNYPAKIKISFKFPLWIMWTLKHHNIWKAFSIKITGINMKLVLTNSFHSSGNHVTSADVSLNSGCPNNWQASTPSSHNSYISYMLPQQSSLIPMHLSINASIFLIENDLSCNETSNFKTHSTF